MERLRGAARTARHVVAGLAVAGALCGGLAARATSGSEVGVAASSTSAHLTAPIGPSPATVAPITEAPTTAPGAPLALPSPTPTAPVIAESTTTTTSVPVSSPDPAPQTCCVASAGGPLTVLVNGLAPGTPVSNTGRTVDFSVTIVNYTSYLLPEIAPVVGVERYLGAPGPGHLALGSLERYNNATGAWQTVPLAQSQAGSFLATGDNAAFLMPPGWAQTINYRLQLRPQDAPGTLMLDALAVQLLDHANLDSASVPIHVVSG